MTISDTTRPSTRQSRVFGGHSSVPGILVAYAPPGSVTTDRCLLSTSFTVGRGSSCDLALQDDKVSKRHLRLTRDTSGFWIEDLKSTNGTFVQGVPLFGKRSLVSPSVIRVGRAVLVFHDNCDAMLETPPSERYNLAGPFHSSALIQRFEEATKSSRHILLGGPSGVGKELAARAITTMISNPTSSARITVHNAARFSSEEEAASTLFGVGAKVFSSVDPRPGLIELSEGGVLFLDEIHNLPKRVQRTLLRVIEDGCIARIGETKSRRVDVRFILASNYPEPTYGLAHDLLARLRVVNIAPLRQRTADIPEIFATILSNGLSANGLDPNTFSDLIKGDHYEAMCLDGFPNDNVRGIGDLADQMVSKILTGAQPANAVALVFLSRFGDGPVARRFSKSSNSPSAISPAASNIAPGDNPVPNKDPDGTSHYENHKEAIIAAYRLCNGNLSATERRLKADNVRCTRRWLGIFLKEWNER